MIIWGVRHATRELRGSGLEIRVANSKQPPANPELDV